MVSPSLFKIFREATSCNTTHTGSSGHSKYLQTESVGVGDAMKFVGQGGLTPKHQSPIERTDPNLGLTDEGAMSKHWSHKFQWLPSNVTFRADGTSQFTSYINNLHPETYPKIYGAIERLIDSVIPAWDQCLREQRDYEIIDPPGRSETRFRAVTKA